VLTKPGIIRGNVLNATAGFLLASGLVQGLNAWRLGEFLLGLILIIAAACVFNNYLDRGIDAKMARTSNRALVNGQISTTSALLFGASLCVAGFVVLGAYTNQLTFWLGVLAIFSYVITYGYFKRVSVHGTLVGTLPGALPIVAGYTAVTNTLDGGALLLFFILVCWQMAHFYGIALYRFKDYKAAGIPVMPVARGINTTKRQIIIYMIGYLIANILLSVYGYTGYIYAGIMVLVSAYWLYSAASSYRTKDSVKWGKRLFLVSLLVIIIQDIMLSIGSLLP
jgi:protoheme IX farnesyltransferase